MIVGDELKSWIADGECQRRTQKAIDSFALGWAHGQVFQRLSESFTKLPERTSEAVTSAACALFQEHEWVGTLLDQLAAEMTADPYFEPAFRFLHSDIHNGLLVYEDAQVAVAAGVIGAAQLAGKKNVPRGPASIAFTGVVSVMKIVKAGGANLSFWSAPPIGGDFAASEAPKCAFAGRRRLADGEILVVDGRCQSYVIEHASSDMVVLQASVKLGQAPLSIEYDSATLGYVGCSATDDVASRIQMMATLLRKMGRKDAFDTLAELLGDANFFVRWHVMRELLGLDAMAAMPHLWRFAESDPHPDVRRAARQALDRIMLQHPSLAETQPCPA